MNIITATICTPHDRRNRGRNGVHCVAHFSSRKIQFFIPCLVGELPDGVHRVAMVNTIADTGMVSVIALSGTTPGGSGSGFFNLRFQQVERV